VSGTLLVGLLGCGRSAEQFHVPAIARLPNARLTAAWDDRPERRQLIARLAPGCRSFDSVEGLLEARVVDAVLIASPAETHGTLAVKALGAGLPVLIEPPLAVSLEEAEWIREAERIVRLPLMVGFNRRWWDPAERVRRVLAGSLEGDLAVEGAIVIDVADADPFVPLTVHLDLIRHIVDREIAVISGRRDSPGEIRAEIGFHGGGTAVCRARAGERAEERITLRAGVRSYEIRSGSERFWPAAGAGRRALDLADSAPRRVLGGRDGLSRSYEGQLGAFIRGVHSRTRVSPGTTDGMAALLAIEALRRSLEEGSVEVAVPATPGNSPDPG
jgi:predicted dehydrogenase